MQYKCDKCSKEFNQKSHYTVHINRKFSCTRINEIDNTSTIISPQNSSKNPQNSSKLPEIPQKSSQKIGAIIESKTDVIKSYMCNFCNKKYSRSDNFKRHQLQFCK